MSIIVQGHGPQREQTLQICPGHCSLAMNAYTEEVNKKMYFVEGGGKNVTHFRPDPSGSTGAIA